MMPRLRRQLNTPITYFETSTYFGPDRRRFGQKRNNARQFQHTSQSYRRIEIKRDPLNGVQILGDTSFGQMERKHSHVSFDATG